MYDGEQRQLKQYLESVQEKQSAQIILIKEDLSHIYAIQKALSENAFVCMHADRFLPGNKTVSGMLLNQPALFPAGPFILAKAFRVPVSFVFAMKEGPFDYHFYATPGEIFSGERGSGIQPMLDAYCRAMEKSVRKYPLQWFNYFDFWKSEDPSINETTRR